MNFWDSRFNLVKNNLWWKREYRGVIEPLIEYEFSLSLETLTGRHNIKRPNKDTTHQIIGTYSLRGSDEEFRLLTFYCERFTNDKAMQLHERFVKEWLGAVSKSKSIKLLSGGGSIKDELAS